MIKISIRVASSNLGGKKTLKAAIYARCSTLLNQDPENQLVHLRQYITNRGFTLVKELVDHGVSGAKERRPALDELVKLAKTRQIDCVVTASIDRIARDTRHLLNLIAELEHFGVSIISLREHIDFSTPLGRATLTIIGAIASLERQLIKERIRNALAAKKMAAEKSGTTFNIGRPKLISKKLCEDVKQLKKSGKSIRNIAEILRISKSTVQRILKG